MWHITCTLKCWYIFFGPKVHVRYMLDMVNDGLLGVWHHKYLVHEKHLLTFLLIYFVAKIEAPLLELKKGLLGLSWQEDQIHEVDMSKGKKSSPQTILFGVKNLVWLLPALTISPWYGPLAKMNQNTNSKTTASRQTMFN